MHRRESGRVSSYSVHPISFNVFRPSVSSEKLKPKRKRPIKTEKTPLNEEELAEEVLREEYASRVKPEIGKSYMSQK